MENEPDLLGIIVNLQDYTIGADRGGDVSMFDDFDIDYNQYKYLIETRSRVRSTKLKSALVIHRSRCRRRCHSDRADLRRGDHTITIPTDANVDYSVDGTPAADGSTSRGPGRDSRRRSTGRSPTAGYYFAHQRRRPAGPSRTTA